MDSVSEYGVLRLLPDFLNRGRSSVDRKASDALKGKEAQSAKGLDYAVNGWSYESGPPRTLR